ncbi:MAG: hypothetical protein A3G81_19465 [Betaproteobacteria bacterium RIFCSPLOWO2_12_FULL_65_14]|nr:MAG: hypothetical protein A3G81_19465 [Betaproteobacteria bacterium RIFCSPLOWO2_12_FULL_65_14]
MKILLVSTLYAPNILGGAERVAQDLAEDLARRGHSVRVACLAAQGEARGAELNGVHVDYLSLRNLYWPYPVAEAGAMRKALWHALDTYNPSMAHALGRLLDVHRPDVVNTHNISGFSVAAWKAVKERRLPLVHTLHDHYLLCPYTTMFRGSSDCKRQCLECRVYGSLRRRGTRQVDGVVGVSRYILDKHLELGCFANTPARVVYSGYDASSAAADRPPRASGSPLRIGYLGRIIPIKGVDRLIDAFLALSGGLAELWIAGAGDPLYEAALKKRTANRGDVRWLGFVRPEAVLRELDVLVVSSRVREAMGRVVVEGFSFGLPVAGANRGAIPELIGEDCGWVFDPDRPGELISILQHCVEQPERLRAMKNAAYSRARGFTRDATVSGYLTAYREAIGDRARQ